MSLKRLPTSTHFSVFLGNKKQELCTYIYDWGLVFIFLGCIAALGSTSLENSHWVNSDDSLSLILVLGTSLGIILSFTRWNTWISFCYALIIGLFVNSQGTGHILIPINDLIHQPISISSEQLNLRVFFFTSRLQGWIDTLGAGQNVQDTGLFVLIMGLLVWICCVWMSIWVIRKKQILIGILPIGFLLAVNIHLSKQPTTNLLIFLIISLFLLASVSYSQKKSEWLRRKMDYPWDFMDWPSSTVLVTLAIALIIWVTPIVATPEGRHKLSEFTRSIRQKQAQTAERLFASVNPPRLDDNELPLITNVPNMAVIGLPIPSDNRTIMYVKIDDPPPPSLPDQIPLSVRPYSVIKHYWRSKIYSFYNGVGWDSPPTESAKIDPLQVEISDTPNGRYVLEQKFELLAANEGILFSVNDVFAGDSTVQARKTIPDQSVTINGEKSEYTVKSWATKVSSTKLKSDTEKFPPEIATTYLQIPGSLPNRVRNLSARLIGSIDSEYQKAITIQNYLRENYEYDTIVKPPPQGQDAVDYFLFDSQKGFCSYFSSAMVVLLRSSGVPARVVAGYAMGNYDPERGSYNVQANGSHAWVEVYFPSYGWVEFEPTPAQSTFNYREDRINEVSQATNLANNEQNNDDQLLLLVRWSLRCIGGFVFISLLLLWWAGYFKRFSNSNRLPSEQAFELYAQIRKVLKYVGLGAEVNVTPNEFLEMNKLFLRNYPKLIIALENATTNYVLCSYSTYSLTSQQINSSKQTWYSAWFDVIKIWRLRLFNQNPLIK